MNTYTPNSSKIVHYSYVDFSSRLISRPVHIVQYDDSIPILAVKLYNDGQSYTLPSNANVNLRLGKSDGNFVYNPALGCDSSKQTVYFEITQQMAVLSGEVSPVVEIEINNEYAASGSIGIVIDKNPIQQVSIESSTEYITGKQFAQDAIDAAARAAASQSAAKTSETNAANSKTAAKTSETNAKASETNAANSKTAAKTSETNAKISETNAANSAKSAKTSETNAKTSETNAANSKTAAAASQTAAKTSETNAKTSETNAKQYADNAKISETNAASSKTAAKTSETNAKTSETNAANSKTAAAASQAAAKTSETNAKISETNARSSETSALNYSNQAKAALNEILGADIGQFGVQLANQHCVTQPIYDSSGELIIDSNNNNIERRTIFADIGELTSIKNNISALECILMEILHKLLPDRIDIVEKTVISMQSNYEQLETHTLLDSSY